MQRSKQTEIKQGPVVDPALHSALSHQPDESISVNAQPREMQLHDVQVPGVGAPAVHVWNLKPLLEIFETAIISVSDSGALPLVSFKALQVAQCHCGVYI